jgi:uncharacterized repeat protein (TIGR03837 family)
LSARERWDLFCRVVDHYGDIGIAWRLARQLAGEDRSVRLVVDNLDAFARIEPRVDAARAAQVVAGVAVDRWPQDEERRRAADVVVELLGCGLPSGYLDAMAGAESKPCWIDYEHLSAEPWVERFHGHPSPHPTRPLVKHFFYPGFGERTGGLLIEPGLDRERAAFVADDRGVAAFLSALGVAAVAGEKRISMFAYADAPVAGLLDALAGDSRQRWSLIVPPSGLQAAIDRWRGGARTRGSLSVASIPFVDQAGYDRLTWSCDVNFVRGEDSFVRAQAAGKPFVWHVYRQADDVHLGKLAAFADRFEARMDLRTARAERAFWNAWNTPQGDVAAVAGDWISALPDIAAAADRWRSNVASESPLVDRLIAFAAGRRASQ